ncbi:hypothetical protein A2U01_0101728, partial [Trifolium medium]|nr:hypothetical protein [Trifolium medium]
MVPETYKRVVRIPKKVPEAPWNV